MTNNGTPRLSAGVEMLFMDELRRQSNYFGTWQVLPAGINIDGDAQANAGVKLCRTLDFSKRPQVFAELAKLGWTKRIRESMAVRADDSWPLRLTINNQPAFSTLTVLGDHLYERLPLQAEINEFLVDNRLPSIDSSSSSLNWALMRGLYLPDVAADDAQTYSFAHKLRTYMVKHCLTEPRVVVENAIHYVMLDVMRIVIMPTRNGWARFALEFDPKHERTAI